MKPRQDLDPFDALRDDRPRDPTRDEATAAADRIVARVAMRIRSQQRRRSGWRWGIAAAALLAVGIGAAEIGAARRVDEERVAPTAKQAEKPTPSSLRPLVANAVLGDAVARNRLRSGGRAAREAILRAAEDDTFVDRAGALRLIRISGPLQGEKQIARVARLVEQPAVRAAAVEVLARALGSRGARALGDALVAWPQAEADVLAGVRRVVRSGRREAALQALLRGIAVERAGALALALDVAGPMGLPRVLDVVPPALAGAASVQQAVRACSDLVRARLVRLAGRGSVAALRLVGEAGLPDAVRVLAGAAVGQDAVVATAAVGWLDAQASVDGDVALARVVDADGPAARAASAALEALGPQRVDALTARARRSRRDRLAALRALASCEEGVARVERLARHPRLFESALVELQGSSMGAASLALARLGSERQRFDAVLRALIERLRRGRPLAADGLLGLARSNDARAVMRAVQDEEAATELFERARADEQLRPHVEAVLRDRASRGERVGPRRRVPGVARTRAQRRSAI